MKHEVTICVPLRYDSFEEVVNAGNKAQELGAQMVEIWLDSLPFEYGDSRKEQKLLNELFLLIDLPIICVNKAATEHGAFHGDENARVDLLCKAVLSGVDYVDIGIHTDVNLMEKLKNTIEENGGMTQLIISYHDFEKTPGHKELEEIVLKAIDLGADVIKVATAASEDSDNDKIFKLLDFISKKGKKGIGIAMGEKGELSRRLACDHGSLWTYGAIGNDAKTAPGQLTINELFNG